MVLANVSTIQDKIPNLLMGPKKKKIKLIILNNFNNRYNYILFFCFFRQYFLIILLYFILFKICDTQQLRIPITYVSCVCVCVRFSYDLYDLT